MKLDQPDNWIDEVYDDQSEDRTPERWPGEREQRADFNRRLAAMTVDQDGWINLGGNRLHSTCPFGIALLQPRREVRP